MPRFGAVTPVAGLSLPDTHLPYGTGNSRDTPMRVLHHTACGKSSPSSRPICPGRRPEYPQAVHTVTHTVIRTHLPRFLSYTPCGARRPWLPAVPTRNYA